MLEEDYNLMEVLKVDELISKCWQIKNAFNIGIQVLDNQFKTILHISDDHEPLVIIETRKKMYLNLQHALVKADRNSFCYYTDSFQLSYMAVAIQEDELHKGMVVVGPFLNDRVTDNFIWKVMKDNRLENNWLKPLELFYKSLVNLAPSYLAIGDLIVNILVNPHIKSQIITTKNEDEQNWADIQPLEYDQDGMEIKLRYEAEKKLLHFIEIGDKENARKAIFEHAGDFSYRVPGNPLRARKNLTFSGNTMFRIAASKGGVEPQYLHAISEKYALKIEGSVSMSELEALNFSMVDEYCAAVNNFAIKGHSPVVKKALMYINLHFNESINLQSIADEIGFNRTYLAKKFKNEMNLTVIDYIQRKRIDEAIFLIELGRSSITEIGMQVGFSSYNYFCKVFKDIKGMTASEYKGSNQLGNGANA